MKAKKGIVLAQDAKLSVKFSKDSFAASLVDEGARRRDGQRRRGDDAGRDRAERHDVRKAQPQTYTAKTGKTGKAK